MSTLALEPKIYVACLAAYNSGHLHGEWIDANQDADAIQEAVQGILASSPVKGAEEWAIHDYEDFGGINISEGEDLEKVAEMPAFITEHGKLGAELISHMGSLDEAHRMLEDCYYGAFDSEADFAEHITEETSTVPENLIYYIDYEKMARDLFINDFFSVDVDHKVHVFSNY